MFGTPVGGDNQRLVWEPHLGSSLQPFDLGLRVLEGLKVLLGAVFIPQRPEPVPEPSTKHRSACRRRHTDGPCCGWENTKVVWTSVQVYVDMCTAMCIDMSSFIRPIIDLNRA